MKKEEIEKQIEAKRKKLRLAEQNYKETRSDSYLVEQHNIKQEIESLQKELSTAGSPQPALVNTTAVEPPTEPGDGGDHEENTPAADVPFVAPSNVEELPSAISKHIILVHGNKTAEMGEVEIAAEQKKRLEVAREFYIGQNDVDAVERVDEMLEKVATVLGDGDKQDGDNDKEDKTTAEAPKTPPAAPQTPKTTKNTSGGKNGGSSQKNTKKSGKK